MAPLNFQEIITNVEIIDAGSEGKAVARIGEMVVFVPFVVPGDIVDIQIVKKKKSYIEGKAVRIVKYSEKRADPFCEHFGTCGGCRWQHMSYEAQLFYKQKQVEDNLIRIGRISDPVILPILPSEKTQHYRNKLEFTFSNKRWLMDDEMQMSPGDKEMNALGFHLPLMFDRVLDINTCYLQPDPSNAIRLEAKKYAIDYHFTFYDARKRTGFLRNLLIRNANTGDLMVILVTETNEQEKITALLDHLIEKFPGVTSVFYVINPKKNDSTTGLPFILYHGQPYITEKVRDFCSVRTIEFRIGPSSFFQTNPDQAVKLYRSAAEFAGFRGDETVYDLYSGIGTIASYIASGVNKVISIESSAEATDDAISNAGFNKITNVEFFSGEAEKMLTQDFAEIHGHPDIVITDPPRAGMHEKVIRTLLELHPGKIVYVSCNPATQARDIALMKGKYELLKCQPVDMFPQTHHVENVALLVKHSE
jgi:23S rRNA (uracil1939-C5)-methyltransferase